MATTTRKLIGKGAFTKAYLIGDNKVEVVSVCPAKECYAMFSQGNKFAPVIEVVDTGVFHMPLYPKMKAITRQLNAESLHIYRQLRTLMSNYNWNPSYNSFCNDVDGLDISDDAKCDIKNLAGDVCNSIDCNNLRFEISPRNISCDVNGNLVMLDCFFCIKTLGKVKNWFGY
jgi:hypothetical protein